MMFPSSGQSGLGNPVEVFKSGEIIQSWTKWNELRERPGYAVADLKYKIPDSGGNISM